MAVSNKAETIGQLEIREAADRVVDSVLLKTTDTIPDQEQVREVRASVERQINDLIVVIRDHVSQLSQHSLSPTFSPKEIAQNMRITVDKVLAWIHNGQLEAIDVSSNQRGRRRYRVDAEAIARFKAARNTAPVKHTPKRRRKKRRTQEFCEFF